MSCVCVCVSVPSFCPDRQSDQRALEQLTQENSRSGNIQHKVCPTSMPLNPHARPPSSALAEAGSISQSHLSVTTVCGVMYWHWLSSTNKTNRLAAELQWPSRSK
eukprot:m.118602 g.118602  ORF g.118602 m.118602 type:complete len:105 (-) comp13657_c2_seq2:43-357(-)